MLNDLTSSRVGSQIAKVRGIRVSVDVPLPAPFPPGWGVGGDASCLGWTVLRELFKFLLSAADVLDAVLKSLGRVTSEILYNNIVVIVL
jgi:hypothetical protein